MSAAISSGVGGALGGVFSLFGRAVPPALAPLVKPQMIPAAVVTRVSRLAQALKVRWWLMRP